ncbi:MAG: tRNA pseudouridine(38-40) synthase TruA [Marinilabiliales bacterium]|nr:tRNA pseudouridine(38-40) synthase TruA [Marinilabiliales bacterium]
MRYFIQLSYDGTHYHGWQSQRNARSVQDEVEKALTTIQRTQVEVTGAGRTDTGVHASFYIAHFDSDLVLWTLDSTLFRLNCLLPADIALQEIFAVRADAHARFDALYREYRYVISFEKDPFTQHFASRENRKPDLQRMNEAARILFEYNDFTSFSKLGSDNKTNLCRIDKAVWTEEGKTIVFTIRADRFLRNMVRAIVGTLLAVGQGKLSLEGFRGVIESKDRGKAGASADARGLFLADVGYPDDLRI